MRAANLFPPVGWLISTAVAGVTGLALQSGDSPPVADYAAALASDDQKAQVTLSLPIRADPERALAEFRERPLLAEGRRPILPAPPEAKEVIEPEIPPPTVVETPPARPALVMLGSIEKSDGRQVLLRDDTTGHEAWLGIGDAQAGWTVVAIQPESVTLQLQGAEITLHLFN